MKRALPWVLGVVILTAVVAIGLGQAGGRSDDSPAATGPPFDLATAKQELAGSPKPLAALHAQSAALLGGGVPAFERRLAQLKGRPVVINKWASWCNPCRAEFPAFQQVATQKGKDVAFLGVNAGDSVDPAKRFLQQYPVPFPSYVDPDEKIARELKVPANYPMTVFVDAKGKVVIRHSGGFTSAQDLSAAVEKYLG